MRQEMFSFYIVFVWTYPALFDTCLCDDLGDWVYIFLSNCWFLHFFFVT